MLQSSGRARTAASPGRPPMPDAAATPATGRATTRGCVLRARCRGPPATRVARRARPSRGPARRGPHCPSPPAIPGRSGWQAPRGATRRPPARIDARDAAGRFPQVPLGRPHGQPGGHRPPRPVLPRTAGQRVVLQSPQRLAGPPWPCQSTCAPARATPRRRRRPAAAAPYPGRTPGSRPLPAEHSRRLHRRPLQPPGGARRRRWRVPPRAPARRHRALTPVRPVRRGCPARARGDLACDAARTRPRPPGSARRRARQARSRPRRCPTAVRRFARDR